MPLPSEQRRQNKLKEYRRKRQLRLRDVAKLVDVPTPTHVWEWERGGHVPTLHNALRLAAAINCPVEVLFSQDFNRIRQEVIERRERLNIKRSLI